MSIDIKDLDVITPEWVKQFDKGDKSPAWISDSWLAYSGICYNTNRPLYDWCEKILSVKKQMVEDGYVFEVDKLC